MVKKISTRSYNQKLNYCTMSPDSLFGVKFNYSCFIHDRQYRNEAVYRKTRKQADKSFRKMIFAEFKRKDKPIRGWIVSWIYYYSVRLFARKYWRKNG